MVRMVKRGGALVEVVCSVVVAGCLLPGVVIAQPQTKTPAAPPTDATQRDLGGTQARLMELLRVSPTLANVVASDPSLLGNQEYVGRSNPELAEFLQLHPEIGRNPAFYLFSNLRSPDQRHYQVLEPKRGFEDNRGGNDRGAGERVLSEMMPPVVMVLLGVALLWLIRLLLENRRWRRVFTLQSEVHGRLIDKFASSQELIAYMETEAGRKFLEAAPIALETDQRRVPNLVSRIISTLQLGLVLSLLGAGLLSVRNIAGEGAVALLVLGIVALMPGIGLILSAGITWLLAKRLALIGNQTPEFAPGHELRERQ
jgi:hypothetical protein